MKLFKFTSIAMTVALLVAGCAKDRLIINSNNGSGAMGDKGYLSVSGLTADCRIDERDVEQGTSSTRSGAIDVNTFDCRILNDKNEEVLAFKFGERPAEQIALDAGDYLFEIKSGEVPGAAWDSPVYGCVEPFKIVRKEVTTLEEVVCTLLNIKVTVSYSPDLLERLGEKTLTTAKIGENSMEFSISEERAAFFLAPQLENTIELTVSGTYAADKTNFKNIEMTKTVAGVKAGQHSKILFYVSNAEEGSIEVGVTIRDWVTDEIITCDVKDILKEEEWIEEGEGGDSGEGGDNPTTSPDAPSIVWEGHDISKREPIVSGLQVDLAVSAPKGIKEFYVKIESASLTPSELSNVGLCDVLNLCNPSQSYDSNNPDTPVDVEQPLRDLGFAVGEAIINKTFVKLSITQFMSILQTVSGSSLKNHDFVITVIDNEGNTTVKTLMLQTGK